MFYYTSSAGRPGPHPIAFSREPIAERPMLEDSYVSVSEPPKIRKSFPESWIFDTIDEYVRHFYSISIILGVSSKVLIFLFNFCRSELT
jgi:hypothetical protein